MSGDYKKAFEYIDKTTKYSARQASSFLFFKFVSLSKNSGELLAYKTDFSVLVIQSITDKGLAEFLSVPVALRGKMFQKLAKEHSALYSSYSLGDYSATKVLAKHNKPFVLPALKDSTVWYYSVAPAGKSVTEVTARGSTVVVCPDNYLTIELARSKISERAKVFSEIVEQNKVRR
jgi:hypothetical protein